MTDTQEIQWGREIEVNGVRPAWLADDVQVRAFGPGGSEYTPWRSAWANGWQATAAIRLPADHFSYKALDAGFEPWGGGDAAPSDWDEGEVLNFDGPAPASSVFPAKWQRGWEYNGRKPVPGDIIGYRKRASERSEDDTVTIKRMTEAEWRDVIHGGWARFRELGLIREETRAERFTRETGVIATIDVIKALEWASNQS